MHSYIRLNTSLPLSSFSSSPSLLVCLCLSVSVCLPACLPACPSVCLSVSLSSSLSFSLSHSLARVRAHTHTDIRTHTHTHTHTLSLSLSPSLSVCLSVCLRVHASSLLFDIISRCISLALVLMSGDGNEGMKYAVKHLQPVESQSIKTRVTRQSYH